MASETWLVITLQRGSACTIWWVTRIGMLQYLPTINATCVLRPDDVIVAQAETFTEASKGQGHGCVQLMTFHASKGLEFPCVFVIGVNDSLVPHYRHNTLQVGQHKLDEGFSAHFQSRTSGDCLCWYTQQRILVECKIMRCCVDLYTQGHMLLDCCRVSREWTHYELNLGRGHSNVMLMSTKSQKAHMQCLRTEYSVGGLLRRPYGYWRNVHTWWPKFTETPVGKHITLKTNFCAVPCCTNIPLQFGTACCFQIRSGRFSDFFCVLSFSPANLSKQHYSWEYSLRKCHLITYINSTVQLMDAVQVLCDSRFALNKFIVRLWSVKYFNMLTPQGESWGAAAPIRCLHPSIRASGDNMEQRRQTWA